MIYDIIIYYTFEFNLITSSNKLIYIFILVSTFVLVHQNRIKLVYQEKKNALYNPADILGIVS
jgi:hypothetical protein